MATAGSGLTHELACVTVNVCDPMNRVPERKPGALCGVIA
jgi:hypothetical protein